MGWIRGRSFPDAVSATHNVIVDKDATGGVDGGLDVPVYKLGVGEDLADPRRVTEEAGLPIKPQRLTDGLLAHQSVAVIATAAVTATPSPVALAAGGVPVPGSFRVQAHPDNVGPFLALGAAGSVNAAAAATGGVPYLRGWILYPGQWETIDVADLRDIAISGRAVGDSVIVTKVGA